MKASIVFLRAWLSFAFAAFLFAGCASLPGPRTLVFSEADLSRLLEQQGPLQRRLIDVLDVRVQRPTVRLLPDSDRVASEFEVSLTERVSGKTYTGRLAIDYGLRYDDALQAIRLTQVHVERLEIDRLPSPQQTGLARLGTLIAENLLDDAVLYRLRPEDLKSAEGHGYRPGSIAVTARGVELTLVPIEP